VFTQERITFIINNECKQNENQYKQTYPQLKPQRLEKLWNSSFRAKLKEKREDTAAELYNHTPV